MIKLGEFQELEVVRKKDFGFYLGGLDNEAAENTILLPIKEVPAGSTIGSRLQVFVYRDSSDRLIATTTQPLLTMGQINRLMVKEVSTIGAFLDWGLPKDLLLPFKEQTERVHENRTYPVALYIDKSQRLCATMKIYDYLQSESTYQKDDQVQGYIYQFHEEYGAFVAVDLKYHGLVLKKDLHGSYRVGDSVQARVTKVREDGKLELSLKEKVAVQMDLDAGKIMTLLESYDGILPFSEKASPEVIERELSMSKAAFKRAVGRLYRIGKIELTEGKIGIKD